MNTIKNICLFLILSFTAVLSQDLQIQWSKTYDYKEGNCIDFTHDGGFIFTLFYNYYKGEIIKIDDQGAVQDVWLSDPAFEDQEYYHVQKCNEGYIATGFIELDDSNKMMAILKKLDNQGRQEWEKFFYHDDVSENDYTGGYNVDDYGILVKQTRDKGYILLCEEIEDDGKWGIDKDFWLIKTDPYGEKEWDYRIWADYSFVDAARAIHQTSDDGYIIAYNDIDDEFGHLLRFTADGRKIWEKEYKEYIRYALPTEDGGNIICGSSFLKKVDQHGDEIWEKTIQYESLKPYVNNMTKLDDNSYLFCGVDWDSDTQSRKGCIIKTDNLGNKIWGKTFTEFDDLKQALQISNNEFILFGDKKEYVTIVKIKVNAQQDPTTFELLDPVNNKLGVGTQLDLDWTSVSNVSSYFLELDDERDMSSPLISKIITNSSNYIINDLSDSTQYYWKVRAQFPDGSGYWTETGTFKTMPPPHIEFNGPDGYNLSYVDVGDQYYTDRDYTITGLPNQFNNCLWIKTQNSDKFNTYDDFIQFYLETDATVYIAYDNRASAVPHWLSSSFEQTEYTIENSDEESNFNVWKGRFPAGDVTLGANSASGAEGVQTNYVVLLDMPLQGLDPRDNKTGVGNDVILSWETLGNFGAYDLQLGEDQDMSNPLYNNTNIKRTRNSIRDLDYNKDYYWRVKAHNRDDEDAWSQTQKFHTMDEPPVEIIISWYNPVFAWLEENDKYYIDRNDVVLSIPDQLKNLLWIKTDNDDAQNTFNYYRLRLRFEKEATLYVGFDSRATSLPNWVTDYFSNTGLTITVSDAADELNIWARNVDAGEIKMGANMAEGAENIKSHYVVLIDTNQTPLLSADFGSDVTSGLLPLTVNFSDSSQGIVNITNWAWDFGDGATSSEQNPSHTYENTGNYSVSLTVHGPDSSDTIIKENYITVKNVIANFGANVTMGQAPLTVSFTDSSQGEIDAWLWKFGDGLTSTAQNPTHVYTYGDSFTVSLFVRNPGGSNTMVKTNYIIVDHPTSIDDMAGIPEKFDLLPNYPNPFNPQTTIRFAVPKRSFVKLTIYDINGKQVSNLFSGIKNPGNYAITWNASSLPSGMYFIKMDTETYASVRKCILVK